MASTATEFDSDCVLMLHCDGADTSTTFTDSSFSNTKTVTANGNAQIDTAQSKFGGASGLFDGTGDYLSIADDADWYLGTGDFTIDCWLRFPSNPDVLEMGILSQTVDDNNRIYLRQSGTTIDFAAVSGGTTLIAMNRSFNFEVDTWYHFAFVRTGNDFLMFIDGTQIGLTLTDTSEWPDIAAALNIGVRGTAADFMNGWMDEIRIVKGTAVWTANFTPPTAAYVEKTASEFDSSFVFEFS